MLDELTNVDVIELTLKNQQATEAELELAYRLRDALGEIDLLCRDISAMQAEQDRQDYCDPAPGD